MEPQTPDQNQPVTTSVTEPWHAPLNRVTTVSKILAAVVFITLPFVGFWLGMGYVNEASDVVVGVSMPVLTPDETVVKEITSQSHQSELIDQLLNKVEVPISLVSSEEEAESRKRVVLSNGFASVIDPQPEGDMPWTVSVIDAKEARLVADFNGDGLSDVATIMVENTGGTGQFYSLAVFLNIDGLLRYVGAGNLGDRIDVRKIEYVSGEFKVDIITQGPGEPMCCGTTPETLRFSFGNGRLSSLRSKEEAVLSMGEYEIRYQRIDPTEIEVRYGSPVATTTQRIEWKVPEPGSAEGALIKVADYNFDGHNDLALVSWVYRGVYQYNLYTYNPTKHLLEELRLPGIVEGGVPGPVLDSGAKTLTATMPSPDPDDPSKTVNRSIEYRFQNGEYVKVREYSTE